MSLRKIAALLAASGLLVGVIGTGVGAQFFDTVTAQQNIDVGTFACKIVDATPLAASNGIATDGKSLTFTSPTIMSSDAGSAPFSFTVQNTGSIPQSLTVTSSWAGNLPGEFSSILATPTAAVPLAASGTQVYNAGIQWTALGMNDLGKSGSITYTVNCGEAPAVRHWSEGIAGATSPVFPSTNAINQANGWAYATVNDSTITFQGARFLDAVGGSCLEYRFNDNVPDQRLAANGGNNYNTNVTDGLWPFKCIATDLNPIQTITIPAGVTTFEVRSAFGAEGDERFDWTRFNLLP